MCFSRVLWVSNNMFSSTPVPPPPIYFSAKIPIKLKPRVTLVLSSPSSTCPIQSRLSVSALGCFCQCPCLLPLLWSWLGPLLAWITSTPWYSLVLSVLPFIPMSVIIEVRSVYSLFQNPYAVSFVFKVKLYKSQHTWCEAPCFSMLSLPLMSLFSAIYEVNSIYPWDFYLTCQASAFRHDLPWFGPSVTE